jgi:zona occludens toxin
VSTAVLNLVTGINGSGKTLFLLQLVESLRREPAFDAEGKPCTRPVYYWGIRGLNEAVLPWKRIDEMDEAGVYLHMPNPQRLHEIEANAIIVVDEAHAVFPRGNGRDAVPAHIDALATARWRGHTFFFVTQSAKDLHTFIRSRIGKHFHLVRAFGLERATRYEWEHYADTSSKAELGNALKYEFAFPKEVYTWYKSAEVHAVKKQLPWKALRWIPIGLLVVVALGWLVYHRLHRADSAAVAPARAEASPVTKHAEQAPDLNPRSDAPEWAVRFVERIAGQPASPRFYDPMLKPATFPKIAGCMRIQLPKSDRCTCQTQQGTDITSMQQDECRFYLAHGWFDPSKPDAKSSTELATSSPPPAPGTGLLGSSSSAGIP